MGKKVSRASKTSVLKAQISKEFESSKRTYGSPRIARCLHGKGFVYSRSYVARLMHSMGLAARPKRKWVNTTDSAHEQKIAANVLERRFKWTQPGSAWVSDITYVRTMQGWLYLTCVIDLADRQVIGLSMSSTLQAQHTSIAAMKSALQRRSAQSNLIFHSDRGIQYACTDFVKLMGSYTQSMSRKGNCWDNAVVESFFKTLKNECVRGKVYQSFNQAKLELFEWIYGWYNNSRIHSSLGYLTPSQAYNLLVHQSIKKAS